MLNKNKIHIQIQIQIQIDKVNVLKAIMLHPPQPHQLRFFYKNLQKQK